MSALTTTEIGSIVYSLVSNIPIGISGLMTTLANMALYQAENYTGTDIPITAIPEAYQPAIINLTVVQVLGQMEAQGLGTKSVSIGELSISKGMVEGASENYKKLAYNQLNDLGCKTSYYTTWN